MSAHEVETTKRVWEALQRRDLDGFLEHVDPDVEFVSFIAAMEGGGRYRGYEGIRRWWDAVSTALGGLRFRPRRFEDLGDGGVLTEVVVAGTADGVDVDQRMWHVVQIRDDRAIWWRTFATEHEAKAAFDSRR